MPRFKLRDLLAAVFLTSVAIAVLMPLIQRRRDDSRGIYCRNHLKQIGLALQNYHAAYDQLPPAMDGAPKNRYSLSGLICITPFIEEQALWEQIHNIGDDSYDYPELVPSPVDKQYQPWRKQIGIYQCPTDGSLARDTDRDFGRTNYTFCIGDSAKNIHDKKPLDQVRGMFSPRVVTTFADVTDGLSNTIMAGEIANAQGRRKRGQFLVDALSSILDRPIDCLQTLDPKSPSYYLSDRTLSDLGRGGSWADGAAGHALVQTIFPPNGPSCAINVTPSDGLFSAGSYHVGGGHVLMGDGAVRYISDTIDTGDLSATPPATVTGSDGNPIESPFGVWGELGTRNSVEADVAFDRNLN